MGERLRKLMDTIGKYPYNYCREFFLAQWI